MKNVSKITLSLALMLGLGIASAHAQSATSDAKLEIKTALTITKETGTEINFGTLSAVTPGTDDIVLDANAAADNINTGATTNVARFNVSGQAGANVVFTYDASVTLTNGTPANDITMTPLVVGAADSTARSTAAEVTATAVPLEATAGTYFVWVGGEILRFATAKATGTYTGTFNIAVDYN